VNEIARFIVQQDFLGNKKNNNNYRLRIKPFAKTQDMKIKWETDQQALVPNFQRKLLKRIQKGKNWSKYLKLMFKKEKIVKSKRIAFVLIVIIVSE